MSKQGVLHPSVNHRALADVSAGAWEQGESPALKHKETQRAMPRGAKMSQTNSGRQGPASPRADSRQIVTRGSQPTGEHAGWKLMPFILLMINHL